MQSMNAIDVTAELDAERARRFWEEADTDRDGRITLAEFQAYAAKHPELFSEIGKLRDELRRVIKKEAQAQVR
jgi:hypothetical protein